MPPEQKEKEGELNRTLGLPMILLFTINCIIGGSIFFLPAIGAKVAGPSSIISWAILSIITLYAAACFSELASMFPNAGGIYEFSKQAYGRFASFMVGWVTWLVANITVAMMLVAAIRYLIPDIDSAVTVSFLPFPIPMRIIQLAFCLFWVVGFNYMTYRGLRESSFMVGTFTIITIGLLLYISITSTTHFDAGNLSPFFIKDSFFANASLILIGLFFVSEAFFGLEGVLFLAEETKNPRKIIPRALMIGAGITVLLGLFLVISSLGAYNWEIFGGLRAPFAEFARVFMGTTASKFIILGTYLVILGAATTDIVAGPRLVMALTRDKLFLSQFKQIHPKYKTPYKAIIFQAIATSVFVLLSFQTSGGYETLLQILIPLEMIMLTAAVLCVTVLRFKLPNAERLFRVDFGKIGPIIMVLFYVFLVFMWVTTETEAARFLKLSVSFILMGIPLYFLIELYYNPSMISRARDIFTLPNLLMESVLIPKSIRKETLTLLGGLKDKVVMEYGSGVGTFTLTLVEDVGSNGLVYATSISEKELQATNNRIKRMVYLHPLKSFAPIKLIHDLEQHNRVHPSINYVDAVVSFGNLGIIQNVKKVLREIHALLPEGGKICFVEYGDFFRIIPNVEWLADNDNIQKMFSECGFSVRVLRKKGLLWSYVMVYGIKSSKDVPLI